MRVAPRTAAQLRQPGLSDSALVSLIEDALFEHHLSRDDLADALPWLAARFDPAAAKAWRDNGFDLTEAQCWRQEHFGVKQAVEWRRLGDTPERAREVERRFREVGVTVTDGLRWLDRGFSVDEVCAGRPTSAART